MIYNIEYNFIREDTHIDRSTDTSDGYLFLLNFSGTHIRTMYKHKNIAKNKVKKVERALHQRIM